MARHLLYEAANSLLARVKRPCALRDWALALQARVGGKKARAALARKLAMLMHRLWLRQPDFAWRPTVQPSLTFRPLRAAKARGHRRPDRDEGAGELAVWCATAPCRTRRGHRAAQTFRPHHAPPATPIPTRLAVSAKTTMNPVRIRKTRKQPSNGRND